MALGYEKSKTLRRELATTFPDGVVVGTPWPLDWEFTLAAQIAHAKMHLENVKFHKQIAGLLERAA
jgi:hypothetical protein